MSWGYERSKLLRKLQVVAPALAKSKAGTAAPQFERLWFTDYGVFACNDQIGIVTTLAEGPVCGVPGERLIKLLSYSSSPQAGLALRDGKLLVQSGFKATLVTDTGDPPFTWPSPPEDAVSVMVDDAFVAACRLATDMIDPLASTRQARGVTIGNPGDTLALYATDRSSMLRCSLGPPSGEYLDVILPLLFVEQLVRLRSGELLLAADYAMLMAGETTLWGRYLAPDPEPIEYEHVLNKLRPTDMVELPADFTQAVVRAGVMQSRDDTDKVLVRMQVKDGTMTLIGEGPYGGVIDTLPFDHPDVSLGFDQRLVERLGKHNLSRLGMSKEALLFTNDDGQIEYLIRAH